MSTRSVRAGLESDAQHGSVVPPIYLSSNFAFEAYRKPRKYDYSRSGNPTRDQLADALADLEGGAGARGHVHRARGRHPGACDIAARRAGARSPRLLRRHVPAARGAACAGQTRRGFRRPERCRALAGGARSEAATWCGSRRRAIRCCGWWTSVPLHRRRTRPVRSWRRTTLFFRRCGSSPSRSVRTWSCIRPPSTSTATATWSAVQSLRRRRSSPRASPGGRTPSA